jgi:hypothetical protein
MEELKEIIKSWCPLLMDEKALFSARHFSDSPAEKIAGSRRSPRQVLLRLALGVRSPRTQHATFQPAPTKKLTLKGGS